MLLMESFRSYFVTARLVSILLTLLLISCASRINQVVLDQGEASLWDEEAYVLEILCDSNYQNPTWLMPDISTEPRKEGTSATDVMNHFSKQPEKQKKRGIFIYSGTYRVPDTDFEKRFRSTLDWKLYYDENWRKAEAKLIGELAAECKKEGIPLHVNLSSNLAGKWEKLAP